MSQSCLGAFVLPRHSKAHCDCRCFEQVDMSRHARNVVSKIESLVLRSSDTMLACVPLSDGVRAIELLMHSWDGLKTAIEGLGKHLGTGAWLTAAQLQLAYQTLEHCATELSDEVSAVRADLQNLDAWVRFACEALSSPVCELGKEVIARSWF